MNKYLLTKAVKLINEYSKPLTRPDWKSIKRIPNMGYIYYKQIFKYSNKYFK